MKIAVDLDDVLVDLFGPLFSWHNEVYGTSFQREDITSYNLWEIWGGTKEEAMQKVHEFYESEHFKEIAPVRGSQEGIEKLSSNNELIVVTSRPRKTYGETRECIEKYFPNKFEGFALTNEWAKSGGGNKKSEVCKNLEIEAIIEDSLEYAQECASAGIRALLLDCPWNRQGKILGVKRVFSWEEIVKELERG